MRISKRIALLASFIPAGSHVIDVGCDHALLDIYLTLHCTCTCVATDINERALKGAQKNILNYQVADKIELIHAPGVDGVDPKKSDYIVIAGMGRTTILEIMNSPKRENMHHVLIQSNNDLFELRKQMTSLGYYIKNEETIEEKGITYVMILFEKGFRKYRNRDYFMGPILRNEHEDYLLYLLQKEITILSKIPRKYIKKRVQCAIHIGQLKKELKKF